MKNLHLMPMCSHLDDGMVFAINANFPPDENVFFHPAQREPLKNIENSLVVPEAFSVDYINENAKNYKRIVLHSLFLSPNEIIRLSDEAASKIVWIVWGHDLYSVHKKKKYSFEYIAKETIHCVKKVLRGTYIRQYQSNQKIRRKVGLFQCIGIGFPYDEKMIREKYGQKPKVVYGPVFSNNVLIEKKKELRAKHLVNKSNMTNILIGHSGFEFLEHEKYLQKLCKYKNEKIHIYLVLAYGASEERIQKLRELSAKLFLPDQVSIITEMMEKEKYMEFLSTIDIAIFPFLHQSALSNTQSLAFMGAKMYFHPNGVLAKGFAQGGVKSFDCRKIGRISFDSFIKYDDVPSEDALLFSSSYDKCVDAWKKILY